MTEPNYKEIAEELYKIIKELPYTMTTEKVNVLDKYNGIFAPKRKLYQVVLQTEFVVYAESEEDAEKTARLNFSEENPELYQVHQIEEECELGEWKSAIPYGEWGGRTCKQILKEYN